MKSLLRSSIRLIDRLFPPETVFAHCDIPCGIYDPHLAQIAAQTVVRMHQLIGDLEQPGPDASKAEIDKYANSLSRYIAVKEEHAELCKAEVRIIWADYFKPEHLSRFPKLHETFWKAVKLCSKNKQSVDLKAAEQLRASVDDVAGMFQQAEEAKKAAAAA